MQLPKAEIERLKCAMSYFEYKMTQYRDKGDVERYMYFAKRASRYVAKIAEVMEQKV
jgi:hypothetical protein